MTQDKLLIVTGVTYYHSNDEAAFFEWLSRMICVESWYGEGRDLFIVLKRRPTKFDLQELLAFFFRYDIDMVQLGRFETKSNRKWLRDPQKYWHGPLFGNGS